MGELAEIAVADLAPGGGGGGGEGDGVEAVAGGAAGVGADGAGAAEEEFEVVADERLGDRVSFVEGEDDEVAGVADVGGAGVVDEVVVDEDAPVEEEVLEAVGETGGEEEEEAAGVGAEVVAEEFLFDGGEAALGGDGDEEGGVGGDFAGDGEVEAVDLEIADAELVADDGEAAVAVGFVGAEFAVAGEEVDFFAFGAGDVEEGGGEGLFALEGGALGLAVLGAVVAVEFGEGDDAGFVAAAEEDDVGLVEAEGFGFAAVLIHVEVFDGDLAGGVGVGGVGVFAEETADLGVVVVIAEGGDDLDGAFEVLDIGEGFGGEGEAAVVGEVEAGGVVAGEEVEAAEEGEKEHGLQPEVEGAEPAGGAEAVEGGHQES